MAGKLSLVLILTAALLHTYPAAADWTPKPLRAGQKTPVKIRGGTCSRFSLKLMHGENRIVLTVRHAGKLPESCDLAGNIT